MWTILFSKWNLFPLNLTKHIEETVPSISSQKDYFEQLRKHFPAQSLAILNEIPTAHLVEHLGRRWGNHNQYASSHTIAICWSWDAIAALYSNAQTWESAWLLFKRFWPRNYSKQQLATKMHLTNKLQNTMNVYSKDKTALICMP